MNVRVVFAGLLVVGLLLGGGSPAPAQTKRVIKITMSSWKFEPNIIKLNDGDTVVLELVNVDPQRPHNISSAFLNPVNLTIRGDGVQGMSPDGLKRVQVEAGKSAEVEFVARGRGQASFVCTVFDHASRGMTGALILWPPGYAPGP